MSTFKDAVRESFARAALGLLLSIAAGAGVAAIKAAPVTASTGCCMLFCEFCTSIECPTGDCGEFTCCFGGKCLCE